MRDRLERHAPSVAAFLAMLLVAGGAALALGVPDMPSGGRLSAAVLPSIPLPSPTEDRDGDGYADRVDRVEGDAALRVTVARLRVGGEESRPYLVVGTEDDQGRLGRGRELAWWHLVDYDALGRKPGSLAWERYALRSGLWLVSEPAERGGVALGEGSAFPDPADSGAGDLASFFLNVRDDQVTVAVHVEVWDADAKPHRRLAAWTLDVAVVDGAWAPRGDPTRTEGGATRGLGAGPGEAPGTVAEVRVEARLDLDAATKRAVAERWAPLLRFAEDERFYPTRGEVFLEFHGFAARSPDHRSWTRGFNNGRDAYRLLVADFDGDRDVDSRDVVLLTDILRAGGKASPTVYAHVTEATNGRVAVQFWFLYLYNFVVNDEDDEVATLAHRGDREFVQLLFQNLSEAQEGRPLRLGYSQHYGGVSFGDPGPGEPPFHVADTHPTVYVARGSHASYPVPGTDRALRPAFTAFSDTFDGRGEAWAPRSSSDNGTAAAADAETVRYALEVLGAQPWHVGYKWGPATRYARDLGTAAKPLLQHRFRYPFLDPVHWDAWLTDVRAEDLADLYASPEEPLLEVGPR